MKVLRHGRLALLSAIITCDILDASVFLPSESDRLKSWREKIESAANRPVTKDISDAEANCTESREHWRSLAYEDDADFFECSSQVGYSAEHFLQTRRMTAVITRQDSGKVRQLSK